MHLADGGGRGRADGRGWRRAGLASRRAIGGDTALSSACVLALTAPGSSGWVSAARWSQPRHSLARVSRQAASRRWPPQRPDQPTADTAGGGRSSAWCADAFDALHQLRRRGLRSLRGARPMGRICQLARQQCQWPQHGSRVRCSLSAHAVARAVARTMATASPTRLAAPHPASSAATWAVLPPCAFEACVALAVRGVGEQRPPSRPWCLMFVVCACTCLA